MPDFDPSGSQEPEPILMKLGTVDYLGRHPHDNFGGVAQSGWSGQYVTCHISEFLTLLHRQTHTHTAKATMHT